MATLVSFNGSSFEVPAQGDQGWATGPGNLSAYLIAISTGTLQTVGGNFTLSADVNFGTGFGILSRYFTTVSASPATAGVVRLAIGDTIDWGVGNLALGVSGSTLQFNGVSLLTGNINLATQVTGTLPVGNGGTGQTTFTAHGVIIGNGGSGLSVTGAGSSGQPLLSGGSGSDPAYGTLGIGAGGTGQTTAAAAINALLPSRTRQVLTSGSAATYTTPANCRQLFIRMVGGGGGGSASNTNDGSPGTDTIFNGIHAAAGGGGNIVANSHGGAGGTGGSGSASVRMPGGGGSSIGGSFGSSSGGSSAFGCAPQGGASVAAAANTGAGGNGLSNGSTTGSGGGAGEYVELIINSPSATYTYTIGAGGNGGAAGGTAGTNGGSGVIIVDEFY